MGLSLQLNVCGFLNLTIIKRTLSSHAHTHTHTWKGGHQNVSRDSLRVMRAGVRFSLLFIYLHILLDIS